MARAKKAEKWKEVQERFPEDAVLWSAYGPSAIGGELAFAGIAAAKGRINVCWGVSREEAAANPPGTSWGTMTDDFTPETAREFARHLLFAADVAESGVRPTA